jgi:hypothetical protein
MRGVGRRKVRNPVEKDLKVPVRQVGRAADLLNAQQVVPETGEGPLGSSQHGAQRALGARGTNRDSDLINKLVEVFIAE